MGETHSLSFHLSPRSWAWCHDAENGRICTRSRGHPMDKRSRRALETCSLSSQLRLQNFDAWWPVQRRIEVSHVPRSYGSICTYNHFCWYVECQKEMTSESNWRGKLRAGLVWVYLSHPQQPLHIKASGLLQQRAHYWH